MTVAPVTAITAALDLNVAAAPAPAPALRTGAFGRMLLDGVGQVNEKLVAADKLVTAFAVDDSVPLHQVTFALEQARLSTELMMQIRSRILEGYQEIMRMQL